MTVIEVTISSPSAVSRRPVDGRVLPTGRTLHPLWGWNPSGLEDVNGFPAPGEVRFWRLTVPPAASDGPAAGMHATDTLDFGVLIEGEVVLEVEGQQAQHLRSGDTFVQLGATHHWHNPGDVPAVILVGLVGVDASHLGRVAPPH